MSLTDEMQQLFDNAQASLPPSGQRSPLMLHERFHKRRIRTRIGIMACVVVIVATTATTLFTGSVQQPAWALTLYSRSTSTFTADQLTADRTIMVARLRSIGYPNAKVSIVHGTIVVVNGPRELADPASMLTASPALLLRPAVCFSGPQAGPVSTDPLPNACSAPQYSIQPVTPTGGAGFSMPTVQPDPALAAFPTTTPAQDVAAPTAMALLPVQGGQGSRILVGPTQATLSSRVASATVSQNPSGMWIVTIHLSARESPVLDQLAYQYFHRMIAADLNGVVVWAPVIEPTQQSFTSLNGVLSISGGLSKSQAQAVAAALRSGPLAIPLSVTPSAS
jgi:hypothetical protein